MPSGLWARRRAGRRWRGRWACRLATGARQERPPHLQSYSSSSRSLLPRSSSTSGAATRTPRSVQGQEALLRRSPAAFCGPRSGARAGARHSRSNRERVGLALYRRYESPASRLRRLRRALGLHVWQTRRGGEIDFVCGPRASADLVEVKYQSNPDLRGAAAIPRAFPGPPVVSPPRTSSNAAQATHWSRRPSCSGRSLAEQAMLAFLPPDVKDHENPHLRSRNFPTPCGSLP